MYTLQNPCSEAKAEDPELYEGKNKTYNDKGECVDMKEEVTETKPKQKEQIFNG
jgi:hypothetical protein